MPHMTGKIIVGEHIMKNAQEFLSGAFSLELLYSFVIIVCSLMIYFGTKEIYELSNHKGLKYFRRAFLFFAIAYFFRSFIKFFLVYFDASTALNLSPRLFYRILGQTTLFIFIYFSSMAIFYLLYSVMWKKWKKEKTLIYLLHAFAIFLSFISILGKNPLIYLFSNIILFFFALAIVIISHKDKKKSHKNNLYVTYLLLFIFWILNIIDILIPDFLKTFQLLIYLSSSGIFLLILYKVIKNTGTN